MIKVATLNCNGVRAALRKGLEAWIRRRQPDILCLQEIRATPAALGDWANGPDNWHAYWQPAVKPGYAGVALLSAKPADTINAKFGHPLFDQEGRWLEARFGDLTVISLYLPSGTSGAKRQQIKYQCMDLLRQRLKELQKADRKVIVAGDINIAHTKKDIKNWKNNLRNSGFLPQERAWMDKLVNSGAWIDVFRQLDQGEDLYTWWTQRGNCRQRNVGWRIDYQLATAVVADTALRAAIDKDPILSDHAPVVIDYAL